MPANSCMLPANTAVLGVFVLRTNRDREDTTFIYSYNYMVQQLFFCDELLCVLPLCDWVRGERTKHLQQKDVQWLEGDEKVWRVFTGASCHQKSLIKFHFTLFSPFVIQSTCFLLCAFATIIETYWWYLKVSFSQKCLFKDNSYLNQDQILKHSCTEKWNCKQISYGFGGKETSAGTRLWHGAKPAYVWKHNMQCMHEGLYKSTWMMKCMK